MSIHGPWWLFDLLFMDRNNEHMNRNVIITFANNDNNHILLTLCRKVSHHRRLQILLLDFRPRSMSPFHRQSAFDAIIFFSVFVFFFSIFDYCEWMGRDPFMAMRQLVRSSIFVTIKGSEIGTQLLLYWFVWCFLKFGTWNFYFWFFFWRIAFVLSTLGQLSRSYRKWISKTGINYTFQNCFFILFIDSHSVESDNSRVIAKRFKGIGTTIHSMVFT